EAAAQEGEARAPPGVEARVLRLGGESRERRGRAVDGQAEERVLEQVQELAELGARLGVDARQERVDLAGAVDRLGGRATRAPRRPAARGARPRRPGSRAPGR